MFQGILEWVMDTKKKGDKEVQERIMLLQKEKDQVGCHNTVQWQW